MKIMSDYYTGYDDFKDLKKDEPELAKELLEKRAKDVWRNYPIYKFECVEDFAYYELTEGWYADVGDDSIYFWASDGEVLKTEYGW